MTTFADVYEDLRRPFSPAAVRFKVQAQWPREKPTGALIVAFIDARLAAGRLNAVCPQLWSTTFERPEQGKGLICHLTIDGITRSDFGQSDYENAKGDYSDALKRAAVHFGVAESLYVLPKMILNVGNLLQVKGNGKLEITSDGEKYCRSVYTDWLEQTGKAAFGDPLDHGDEVFESDEPATASEILADLIGAEDFNPDQKTTIRKWIGNGNGKLDSAKADKAIHLLQAGEPETLLERAEGAS